jgi:hypothetical protein
MTFLQGFRVFPVEFTSKKAKRGVTLRGYDIKTNPEMFPRHFCPTAAATLAPLPTPAGQRALLCVTKFHFICCLNAFILLQRL